jgi:hypothetical protein
MPCRGLKLDQQCAPHPDARDNLEELADLALNTLADSASFFGSLRNFLTSLLA